jgi:hypothetical protein
MKVCPIGEPRSNFAEFLANSHFSFIYIKQRYHYIYFLISLSFLITWSFRSTHESYILFFLFPYPHPILCRSPSLFHLCFHHYACWPPWYLSSLVEGCCWFWSTYNFGILLRDEWELVDLCWCNFILLLLGTTDESMNVACYRTVVDAILLARVHLFGYSYQNVVVLIHRSLNK